MARYAWLTDIHLDHLSEVQAKQFIDSVAAQNIDGLLITGDIGTSKTFIQYLAMFESALQKPVLFVMGNHDYWGSSAEQCQKTATDISSMSTFIKWAASTPYITLSTSTALVGHDGWYDALYADKPDFSLRMNDWITIREYVGDKTLQQAVNFDKGHVVETSRKLAHAATLSMMNSIKAACRYSKRIIVLTHVPPFICHPADNVGLSWFSSRMMGDMLRQAAKSYPNVHFTVLSGHTHSSGMLEIDKNMVCHVGQAEYGRPEIVKIIEVI